MILNYLRKEIDMVNITSNAICIEQAISMLCCWVDDPDGDYFKKHLARLKEYIWVAEDGIKMQVSTPVLQNNCGTFYLSIEYLNLSKC